MSKFHQNSCEQWIDIQKRFFGTSAPTTQVWTQPNDIIQMLTPFCGLGCNHMFLPTGGGLDLDAVTRSHEPSCLELMTGSSPNIVSPARLIFESFPDDLSLSYFRLETKQLAPSGGCTNPSSDYEEVVELSSSPLHYIERSAWDDGSYHDNTGLEVPLPQSARLAVRYFSGSFVVFAKHSLYNSIQDTYDARHNTKTAPEFRTYVQSMMNKTKREGVDR